MTDTELEKMAREIFISFGSYPEVLAALKSVQQPLEQRIEVLEGALRKCAERSYHCCGDDEELRCLGCLAHAEKAWDIKHHENCTFAIARAALSPTHERGAQVMFIDCPDGSVCIPLTSDVLTAAEMARESRGRLRLVVCGDISTSDPMVGCILLGDYRE